MVDLNSFDAGSLKSTTNFLLTMVWLGFWFKEYDDLT